MEVTDVEETLADPGDGEAIRQAIIAFTEATDQLLALGAQPEALLAEAERTVDELYTERRRIRFRSMERFAFRLVNLEHRVDTGPGVYWIVDDHDTVIYV